ncbi:MAG: hypothetical protein COA58_15660 [Bacteroidetes bacterium]|nr:MAG: hypothetical protein COA58_15660 [Bacteroidota bacterium]
MREDIKETVPTGIPYSLNLIKHYNALEEIEEFEDKVAYWNEHLNELDLFKQLYVRKKDNSEILLTLLPYVRSSKLDLFLIQNIIREHFENKSMRGHQIIKDFLEEIENLEIIEESQRHYIEKIDSMNIPNPKRPIYGGNFEEIGYKSFAGRYDVETACKKIYNSTINKGLTVQKVLSAFDGFCMAYARKSIKDYKQKIEQKYSIPTNYIGLFIYAFGLENKTEFKDLKLNATDIAKIYTKAFNLEDNQVENIRKVWASPKVSKPFLQWFKQFGIDPKDTHLKPFLPK